MSCESVNRAWLDYTGYTVEQALGEGWSRCLHPEDLARWLDTGVRAFDERKPLEIEYRLRRRDGAYRWVLDRAAPRYSGDGAFLGYAGGCVDIDEHKRAQQGLARALERERRLRIATEEASKARQGFTISMLQELRSPAQALADWAGQLREQAPRASEAARALEAIERGARTQSRIISNLLDLAQVGGADTKGLSLLGVRVLVLDPDPDARESLVKPLEVAGADVRSAASPAEALKTLGSWHPDVLLSASDESFIHALRSLPAEHGGCLRGVGYDAQLAKPVEPVALLATVARLAA
jgi:PAS domain S-box-containing protein